MSAGNGDGTRVLANAAKRLRERKLGLYDDVPDALPLGWRSADDARWMIPGLWRWGTLPVLGGQPKSGKTLLLCDLVAALTVPCYRFLNRFEPAELDHTYGPEDWRMSQRDRGVVLINTETPPADLEAPLLWLKSEPVPSGGVAEHSLTVEHVELLGGAQRLDVTDPEVFAFWEHRLTHCSMCDGEDDYTPHTVLVDSATAVLHAAGKTLDQFGLWYAAWRRLMREIEVPNSLVTSHNTMQGGHLMGGTEAQAGADGLWSYSADNADDPRSTRRFSVRPRLGGVPISPTRVRLDETGRLTMEAEPERASPSQGRPGVAEAGRNDDDAVLHDLREAGAAGMMRSEVTGGGAYGIARRQALKRLEAAGLVVGVREGRGQRMYAAEFAP